MGLSIQKFVSDEELFQSLTDDFFRKAELSIQTHGKFRVALSGGSSPVPFFESLATNASRLKSWDRVYFSWVDERWVPHNHPDSNYGSACQAGLDKLPANFVPFETAMPDVTQACELYEQKLIEHQVPDGSCLDWALLGAGEDAHTASIFQKDLTAVQEQRFVFETHHPQSGQQRVSLTLKGLLKSTEIVVLITGEKKRPLLGSLQNGNGPIHRILNMHQSIRVVTDIL